jgi:large subunit ribosomal protein L3
MVREIIGKKLGMTRLFSEEGNIVPVTVIEAGPCPIIQKKTKDKDGYDALQVGFLSKKPNRVNRPLMGHFKKSGKGAFYVLKELKVDETESYELGQEIIADIFQAGDLVDVSGTNKGRGFTGVMKRHGFRGAPGSHGTHEFFRHGGSIGAAADPSRTFKGKKMPGHFGNRKVTIQNIEVVEVRPQENLIFLKGAIPGWRNGIVTIRQAKKVPAPPRPVSPQEKKEEAIQEKAKVEAQVEAEVKDKAKDQVEGEETVTEKEAEAQAEAKVEGEEVVKEEEAEAQAEEKDKVEAKVEGEEKDKAEGQPKGKAKGKAKSEVEGEEP